MLGKTVAYFLGVVSGVAGVMFLGDYLGVIDPIKSETERALAVRIESIPDDAICKSLVSGAPVSAQDHAMAWQDGTRYLVGGWAVEASGIPVFYWRGADLPSDEPNCGK